MIRQRQKALKTLEILTFKKYWALVHKNKNNDSSAVIKTGLENWFRHFTHNYATSESNQESHDDSLDDDKESSTQEGGFINPLFVSLVEATV